MAAFFPHRPDIASCALLLLQRSPGRGNKREIQSFYFCHSLRLGFCSLLPSFQSLPSRHIPSPFAPHLPDGTLTSSTLPLASRRS
ncbi:hypothetical protein LX36DRAFT_650006 [Colletotrichum falcatum]|nr:hypothetical protein LX36DRAFT_650006 [Colletotrichum falcatum]